MSSPWQTDEEYRALEERLRSRLTDEFLATLVEAADLTLSDPVEVESFVVECFQMAGKKLPEKYQRTAD